MSHLRLASIVSGIALLTACASGSGELAGDTAVSDSAYLEVDLSSGIVSAVAAPDDAALTAHRWRSSHMLFHRVDAGPAPGCITGLPQGGEPEDGISQTGSLAWMAVFEMTASQWQLLSGSPDAAPGETPAIGLAPTLVHDVIRTAVLSRFRLDLPDAGTWMRACGDGQDSLFSWGSSTTPVVTRGYAVHYLEDGSSTGIRQVGSLRPNSGGFFDMHGNVAEVTVLPAGGYAVHGGAWDSPILSCRTANSIAMPDALEHPSVGYRLVLRP